LLLLWCDLLVGWTDSMSSASLSMASTGRGVS
jgi:hypothetical protein